ncbi:Retrovirus-related Pol polyprotein from transposon TNT 1-94 [Dendrobium catenatum]|uniref:Retrovirus-related Pol polyprotein from transposon TNT 1-94 n=1 Tax=Dendrobium catenatum TaxID=906689 RepID=A0A2I0W4K7_9ASPA|nr:Retrovirus-related Pol polyprotein from transposon TNT 1-94 [Dendrobium catenatum]
MVSEPDMAEQETASSVPPASTSTFNGINTDLVLPASLKFIISNFKNLIPHPLTADNYAIWKIQISQNLTANGFTDFLTGKAAPPSDQTSQDYARWRLIGSNLISALFSTISPALLPYVINSSSAQEVWETLERQLQSTCRSRVIQLKNELHQVQMNNQTMQHYLSTVKTIVDNIAAAGTKIDHEDIVLYILKGLPASYNAFKTAIRTSSLPADLDKLCSQLCSKEIHINQEIKKEQSLNNSTSALYATSVNQQKNRTSKRFFKNKSPAPRQSEMKDTTNSVPNNRPTCQICGKIGHIALNCWHRNNYKYAPTIQNVPRALLTQPMPQQSWILDSGATNHITNDSASIHQSAPYNGSDSVTVLNGSSLSIHNYGQGLLPLPETPRKLHLFRLLHVPNLTHNLLSVSKLTKDNAINITFDVNGFTIKDIKENRPLLCGRLHNELYQLDISPIDSSKALQTITDFSLTWHARLGHPNNQTLQHLASTSQDVKNISFSFHCNSCKIAKSHKLPFSRSISVTTHPFELVHTDVWGPSPTVSLFGFR